MVNFIHSNNGPLWTPKVESYRKKPERNAKPYAVAREQFRKVTNTRSTMEPLKVTRLKKKQQEHLLKLTALAERGEWEHLQMHTAHPDSGFDWWMFPIDRPSRGHGNEYQMSLKEIQVLKSDPLFMKNYRAGVVLVAKSWGWDLENRKEISNVVQKWTNYQVRLGKMLDSLRLFKQDDLRAALTDLIKQQGLTHTLEPWVQKLLF